MAKNLPDYFKTQRKLYGLTQKELAYLLGYMNGEAISRIERRKREPTLRIVIAYTIIFAISPKELIPGIYQEIEKSIEKHGKDLVKLLMENKEKLDPLRNIACLRSIADLEKPNNKKIYEDK